MNEIVILSGKGGTGKTSVAASLAVLAGRDAIIADCDVDAANMHLLLNPDYGSAVEFYGGELAVIDPDLCSGCDICARTCRFDAIRVFDGQYRINPMECEGCGYCERVCPEKAITMEPRKSGHLYVSQIRTGTTMVHARLDIGAENSGKLVARVKQEAQAVAREKGSSYLIVDGSPGIGCPVTSSLAGANYVLLVTEPTVSGLHDLKRISSMINRHRIKMGCIINKHDLNNNITKEIREYLSDMGIDHLADIFFDLAVPRAMLEGRTIVESGSRLQQPVMDVWNEIKKQLLQ